jgi:hypothetical protein
LEVDRFIRVLNGGWSGELFVAWTVVWALLGCVPFAYALWLLWGREVLCVRGQELEHRHDVWGVGYTKTYRLPEVRGLRLSDEADHLWSNRPKTNMYGLKGGFLVFDYNARTIRVGAALDRLEAHTVLENVLDHIRQGSATPPS